MYVLYTQKKDIEDKYLKLMKGRIFGCDSCQKECPYNKEITYTNIEDFKPLTFMQRILLKIFIK